MHRIRMKNRHVDCIIEFLCDFCGYFFSGGPVDAACHASREDHLILFNSIKCGRNLTAARVSKRLSFNWFCMSVFGIAFVYPENVRKRGLSPKRVIRKQSFPYQSHCLCVQTSRNERKISLINFDFCDN
jgi:hypothetical protein